MTFVKRMAAVTLGGAMVIAASLSFSPAQAGYTVRLTQQGSNVVATGSGTIDLTDLTLFNGGTPIPAQPAGIVPDIGLIITGATSSAIEYHGGSGSMSIGSGASDFTPAASTGNIVGIEGAPLSAIITVPLDYVSGNPLSSTSTWDNETFTTIDVTLGTYVFTWGTGAHADSFTVIIGGSTAVPEPSAIALLGTALAGLAVVGFRARRRASAGDIVSDAS